MVLKFFPGVWTKFKLVSNENMKLRVVTSKNLSIDDVKNNFMDYNFREDRDSWKPNEIEKGSLIIHGVHQEGNTAMQQCPFH